MKKLLLTFLMVIPAYSYAGFSLGYSSLDLDGEISLGGISGAYEWTNDSPFSLEAGVSLGLQDDDYEGVDVELDRVVYLKGKYNVNDQFFVSLNYADISIDLSQGSLSDSASDSDTGFGVGFNVNKNFTIMFDSIEDVESLTFRYNF